MEFWNYHNHSHYSVLDGYQKIEEMVEWAKEHGQKAIALTDHGNMAGYVEFYQMCKENGIKPVIGIEFYFNETKTQSNKHLTVVAKNWEGLKTLFRLTYESSKNENFYKKPTIDTKMLKKWNKDIIVSSGCIGSEFNVAFLNGNADYAEKKILEYKDIFGDDFYLELGLNTLPEQKSVNKWLYELGKKHGIKYIVGADAHYSYPIDAEKHRIFMRIQTNNKFEFDSDEFYLKTYDDAVKILRKQGFNDRQIEEILESHNLILDKIEDYDIKPFEDVVPKAFPNEDSEERIWQLIKENAKKFGIWDNPKYRERIEYEMKYIKELGFIDYFLVVYDIYQFVKHAKIAYGAGRGSSAGSLVCYCLGITSVDPLEHDLLFHRFISPSRITHPDIDMDFEDSRRDEIFKYLEQKYGKECAIRIGTVIKMKAKQSVRDTARALNIPSWVPEKINSYVIERSSGDARASFCVEDTFNEFKEVQPILAKFPDMRKYAPKMEGRVRAFGKHAAGILLTPKPIWEYTAVDNRQGDIVASLDYRQLDSLNLLKFDVLGLNTLTRVRVACELIGLNYDDLIMIDTDDRKVYEAFSRGDNIGIFQFESIGMSDLCKEIPSDKFNFSVLVALNALYRPSTMRSGIAHRYINRLLGKEKVESIHPLYDEVCRDSFGFPIYQEQVMRIFNEMALFSAVDTDATRKKIAKSHGVEELERLRPQFVDGCLKNGINEKIANKVFDTILFFGSYGFNKSHSVVYSKLAYITQWLKVYYPREFYLAWLNVENEKESLRNLLDDAIKHGVKILPPKLNKSDVGFTLEDGAIRCGLKWIDFIGEKTAEVIVENRKQYGRYRTYRELKDRKVANKKQIQILATLETLEEDDGVDINTLVQFYPYPIKWKLEDELKKLSEPYKDKYEIVDIKDIDFEKENETLVIRGIITGITYNKIGDFIWDDLKRWEKGRMYAVLDIEDGTGHIRIKTNPDQYDRHANNLVVGRMALFKVKKWQNIKSSLTWDGVKWLGDKIEKVELKDVDLRDEKERKRDELKSRQVALF